MNLHDRLAALSADQPDQPTDRLPAVRDRARRLRTTRAALVTAAVLAVAVPVALVSFREGGMPATDGPAGAPVSAWKDRSQPGDRTVYDGAVADFVSAGGRGPARWLYRGVVTTPDDSDVAVAVFLADRAGSPVVVTSTAIRSFQGQTEVVELSWDRREQSASLVRDHLGAYINYFDASAALPTMRSLLFALAAPGARRLEWTEVPVPHAPGGVPEAGAVRSQDGIFKADLPLLRGPIVVKINGSGPSALSGSWSPALVPPASPDRPTGWRPGDQESPGSQQLQQDGRYGGTTVSGLNVVRKVDEVVVVLGRCYGGGQLPVSLSSAALTQSGPATRLAEGTLPCDGKSHRVLSKRVTELYDVFPGRTDRPVAYYLATGTVA